MSTCTFKGCSRGHYATGVCQYHYMQRVRGVALTPSPVLYSRGTSLKVRFEAKVKKSSGCWEWLGSASGSGYGEMHNPATGKLVRATHVSLLLYKGVPLKKGQCALHSCDNENCVNPKHLRVGTRRENIMDAVKRGRIAKGEKSGKAKLTDLKVKLMRKLFEAGWSPKNLGRKFNVSAQNVLSVVRRETWRHVA